LATNVTFPAGALATDGTIANSWRATETVVAWEGAADVTVADGASLGAALLVATALDAGAVVGEVPAL